MTQIVERGNIVPRQEASSQNGLNGHKPEILSVPTTPLRREDFKRSSDDPKRISDEEREEERRKRAKEWAKANYGHNDRLNEALLKQLRALGPMTVMVDVYQKTAEVTSDTREVATVGERDNKKPKLTDLDHRNIIPHMATALEAPERTGKVTEEVGQLWPDWRTTEVLIQRREAERHAQALGTLVQERVSNFLKLAEDPGSGYELDTSSDGKTDQVKFEGEIIAQRTTNDNSDLVFTLFTPDLRPRVNGYPAVETDGNQTHVIYFPRTNFSHRNNAVNESSMYINHVLTTYLPEPGVPLKHVPPPQR